MRRACAVLVLVLGACGGDDTPRAGPVEEAPQPAPPPKKKRVTRAELRAEKKALEERIADLEAALKDLTKRHEQELPSPKERRDLRKRYVQAQRDAAEFERDATRLAAELEELRAVAESALTESLKELRKERNKVEKERAEADAEWKKQLDEETVEDDNKKSPVFDDLQLVRAIKVRWFAASRTARLRELSEDERAAVSRTFRAWLGEKPRRRELVALALQQPGAPAGAVPATYDFTDFRLFVLLEMLEERLTRENIAFERTALSQWKVKLEAAKERLRELDNEIRAQMRKGGDKLQAFEEKEASYRHNSSMREDAAKMLTSLQRRLDELESLQAKQAKEADAVTAELEAAYAELEKLDRRLTPRRR